MVCVWSCGALAFLKRWYARSGLGALELGPVLSNLFLIFPGQLCGVCDDVGACDDVGDVGVLCGHDERYERLVHVHPSLALVKVTRPVD